MTAKYPIPGWKVYKARCGREITLVGGCPAAQLDESNCPKVHNKRLVTMKCLEGML